MGLFHYLLIINIDNINADNMLVQFFIDNEFILVEKNNDYASLIYKTKYGEIEIFIDEDKQFSIRTRIQNKVEIIDKIISILYRLTESIKSNITIYDVQNKILLDLTNIENLRELYLKRKGELKEFL